MSVNSVMLLGIGEVGGAGDPTAYRNATLTATDTISAVLNPYSMPFSANEYGDFHVTYSARVTSYNTGTTQATDGQSVATWAPNYTDNVAWTATQATEARKPIYRATGFANRPCLEFDGVAQRLTVPSDVYKNASVSSFIVIFSADTLPASQTLFRIPTGTNSADSRLAVSLLSSGAVRTVTRILDTDTAQTNTSGAGVVTTNTKYALVVTLDNTNNKMNLWLNNVKIFNNLPISAVAGGTVSNTNGLSALIIGARYDGGADAYDFFDGKIAEFGIYDEILSPTDIEDINTIINTQYSFNSENTPRTATLTAPATISATLNAYDIPVLSSEYGNVEIAMSGSLGNQYNVGTTQATNNQSVYEWIPSVRDDVAWKLTQATEVNKPLYRSSAINSRPAIDFDGSNDFMSAPLALCKGATALTIVSVFLLDTVADGCLFSQALNGSGSNRIALSVKSNGSIEAVTRMVSSDPANFTTTGASLLSTNTAYFLVHTLDYTNNFQTITLNGTIRAYNYITLASNSALENLDASICEVGRRIDGTQYFNGKIAELMIFEELLPADKMRDLATTLRSMYNFTLA